MKNCVTAGYKIGLQKDEKLGYVGMKNWFTGG